MSKDGEKSGRLLFRKCYFELGLDCRMGFVKCQRDGWGSPGERTATAKALTQDETRSVQDTQLDQSAAYRKTEPGGGWLAGGLHIGFFSSSPRYPFPSWMFKGKPGRVRQLLHSEIASVARLTLNRFKCPCLDISDCNFWYTYNSGVVWVSHS